MMTMTGVCWWAFTYTREGFMPTMYGSIRACCAATTELEGFSPQGIQWGDRRCFYKSCSVGKQARGRLTFTSTSAYGHRLLTVQ